MSLIFFDNLWKHQKISGVRFSGGLESDQWHEMAYWEYYGIFYNLRQMANILKQYYFVTNTLALSDNNTAATGSFFTKSNRKSFYLTLLIATSYVASQFDILYR